jgi:hypothetical protein
MTVGPLLGCAGWLTTKYQPIDAGSAELTVSYAVGSSSARDSRGTAVTLTSYDESARR